MLPLPRSLIFFALPFAVAVACPKTSLKSEPAPTPVVEITPTPTPSKPTTASPHSTTKSKEHRPLQPWGHYLLTE